MKRRTTAGQSITHKTILLSLFLSLTPFSQVLAEETLVTTSQDTAVQNDALSGSTSADSMSDNSGDSISDNTSADATSDDAMSSNADKLTESPSSSTINSNHATILIDAVALSKVRAQTSSLPSQKRNSTQNNDSTITHYKAGIPCVPLMLVDDPNTLIVSDRDASLKAENRTISLSHGKGIYMVGKHPIVVETPLGSVNLPGNSAAIIEQSENGLLRVDQLTGAPATVAVKRWKGVKAFTAASGEEICLAPKELNAEALAPQDGVAREEIATEIGEGGIQFLETRFAPKTMLEKECLLQCDSNSFFQVRRKVYMLRKTIDEQEIASSLMPKQKGQAADSMPVLIEGDDSIEINAPVNFSEPVSVQLPALRTEQSSAALIKYNTKTDISFDHPSVTQLQSGEALISAKDSTYLRTPHSMLKIDPGTLVLVSVSDDVTKVRTLWENHKNSVSQTVENKPFHVVAGDESLAGNNLRSVYLSASNDMIGRRLTHFTELPEGKVVHFAEVSLMSLAQSDDILFQLMNSNDPVDKSLNRKLNKMAAILVQISASHGLYELMQPPQWRKESKSSSSMPAIY